MTCPARFFFLEFEGSTLNQSIFNEDGDTFQNSPLHLLFYEKKEIDNNLVPNLETGPELTSMSYCKLKDDAASNLPKEAVDLELMLLLEGATAQFVTNKQYQQLLLVLGQKFSTSPESQQQSFQAILDLFNEFNTSLPDNFKEMLKAFDFPYVFQENKTLGQNRRDFKDFFLI